MVQTNINGLKTHAKRLSMLLAGLILWLTTLPSLALAGPVNWQAVPPTTEGQQWWDSGSLRATKAGYLSVLSRFQAASTEKASAQPSSTSISGQSNASNREPKARPMADLYVMEIDCDQRLFRDTSINGIPHFKAPWLPAAGDNLITAVIEASCAAATELGVLS